MADGKSKKQSDTAYNADKRWLKNGERRHATAQKREARHRERLKAWAIRNGISATATIMGHARKMRKAVQEKRKAKAAALAKPA
jgi:hypothetical protein